MPPLQCRTARLREAEAADRAHRLSGAAGRANSSSRCAATGSASGAIGARPRKTSPIPQRCCKSATRWRWSKRSAGDLRVACRPRAQLPRHADGRPQQSAASGADHLRLQDGGAACRLRAPPRTPASELRAARAGRRIRRRRRHAGLARERGSRGAGRADAELGSAHPRIAWHTVRDRLPKSAAFSASSPAPAAKFATRHQADDADRGRGSLPSPFAPAAARRAPCRKSAIPSRATTSRAAPRSCASTSPRCSKPWSRITSAPPARGKSNGSRCRRFSCSPPARSRTARFVLGGLHVDEKRMRANLDITNGLIVSEAVMMGLGPLSRPPARARSGLRYLPPGVATGRPLLDLLAENAEIAAHLDRAGLGTVRSGELSRAGRRHGRPRAAGAHETRLTRRHPGGPAISQSARTKASGLVLSFSANRRRRLAPPLRRAACPRREARGLQLVSA